MNKFDGTKIAVSQKPNRYYFRGFTLVELLVVISIIALLMSILMPALNRARQQGRLVVCASNQRQILAGLLTYSAGNESKLPPDISMNKNGDNVWWDFPNYLACHKPYPVGGSLGLQFKRILPSVKVWLCPLSPVSADTELTGKNGDVRTYEEVYKNPDPDNFTWVWMTYATLWRFGGFADRGITTNVPAFKGPGLEERGFKMAEGRNDDLAIADFVAFFTGSKQWKSSHPFARSSRNSEALFNEGPMGSSGINIISEMGDIRFNAGYIDGHVERFKTSDIAKDKPQYLRGIRFFLPKKW